MLSTDEKYRSLFESMDEGCLIAEVLFDDKLNVTDIYFVEANPAAIRLAGRDFVGRRMREIDPTYEEYWFEVYGRVARTGERVRAEHYAASHGRWFSFCTFKVGDQGHHRVATVFQDVTDRRLAEQAVYESEKKYRTLFDAIDEGFAIFDMIFNEAGQPVDFRYVETNEGFARQTGRRPEPGQTMREVFPEAKDMWLDLYATVARTGQSQRFVDHVEGLDRWYDVYVFSTGEPEQNRLGAIFTDVTERKRAETALRESEDKFRTLFEAMHEGFAICEVVRDPKGRAVDYRYVEVNPAVVRHVGLAPEALRGRLASEVFGNLDPWLLATYAQVVDERRSIVTDHHFAHVDRWLHINVFPRGGDRIAAIYSDVSERKRAEQALRDSERRQAFLLRFTDTIRSEPNEQAVIERAVRMLAEELAVDRAYATRHFPAKDLTNVVFEVRAPGLVPLPATLRFSDFPEAGRQTFERTLVFEDAAKNQTLTEADKASLAAMGVGALLSRPLRRDGSPIFALGVVSTLPRRWEHAEVALVEEATERTWEAAERARAQAALRESEQRFQSLFATSPAPFLVLRSDAPHFTIIEVNDAYLAATMRKREQLIGRGMFEAFPDNPKDAAADGVRNLRASFERALTSGRPDVMPIQKYDITRPDGIFEERWWSPVNSPVLGSRGEVEAIIHHVNDITEEHRAEAALRESEERFRQFADASAAGLWIRKADTLEMEFASPSLASIYGVEPDALLGAVEHWAATVVPDDRDIALKHLEEARQGRSVVHEFRIQRRSDGAFRWIKNTDFPLRDHDGIPRIGGIAEDVTETKLALEHQGILLAELQHRVRNIMAMIRSLARRSADGATTVEEYKSLLEGRLLALARVQALLTREANAGGSLRDIIESEVSAQAHHGGQFELVGADIRLSPKALEVLTLALHELSTNALKYGALSVPEGRLRVAWAPFEKHGRTWLAINWTEEGVPSRGPITRRGFGTDLIEGKIPYELGGTGKITIEPGAARCHLEFPLKDGESILETDAPVPTTIFGGTLDMSGAPDLTGRTVLIVEDDYYLAGDTAAALRGAGATVLGPCPSEDATLDLLETNTPTHAVLDLNLGGGGPRFKIARALRERGVPFVFLTGYDSASVPADLADVVRLQKPLPLRDIVEAVARL